MARRRLVEYPRVVYGPYGACMTIHGPGEWPRGWTATPEGEGTAPKVVPAVIPFTRLELKAKLREKGTTFTESAADSELWRLLNG